MSPELARNVGAQIRRRRRAAGVAPRHLAPHLAVDRLAAIEHGDELATLPELVYIAALCGVPLFDLLPDEAIARTLRTPEEPPALPRAPSINPTIRVFATGPDATEDEYHPEEGALDAVDVHPRIAPVANAIETSVGMDVIRTTAEVGRSLRVLSGNHRELLAALVALSAAASIWLWHPARTREMATALGEVTRRLHNYVAAAATLRDHAARFVDRHYPEGSPGRAEWNARTTAAFGAPERVLVNQLRNYSVHRALPILRAVHGDEAQGGAATFIVLDTTELLESEKWAAPVRAWLEQRELVDLAEVVSGHWDCVQTFYEWFGGWIQATQQAALDELSALERQRDAIVDDISPGLREMFEYMNARKRDENPRRPPAVRAVLRAAAARERRAQQPKKAPRAVR